MFRLLILQNKAQTEGGADSCLNYGRNMTETMFPVLTFDPTSALNTLQVTSSKADLGLLTVMLPIKSLFWWNRPDIEDRQDERPPPRLPASSLDGWWKQPLLHLKTGVRTFPRAKTAWLMLLIGPELTTAFNWVGKGEHLSKLNLVFVAGNGDQGRTRELQRINLTHKHIFRDELKFFKS